MTYTPFSPALGLEIEYKEHTGVISFISEEYLTMCLKKREANMISDVCILVYKESWNEIKLSGTHNR